jgi:hypothetical protein
MLTKPRCSSLLTSALAGALVLSAAACGDDSIDVTSASLVVDNQSDFVIEQLYLTATNNPDWGPNLLGGDVLFPDESLTLGVSCDFYDALLVDENGIDCEIDDLDLCLNSAVWVIRNNTCTVFGAAAKERADKAQAEAAAKATTAAQ